MRVPSNTGSKFPTQKPAIDKVAEHIDAVVTVATSIDSGQFDKVSVPEVGTVAGISKQVVAVAEVEQYVRMLALDLSNVDKVAKELGGVLNVSSNMATVLLLHSRMADLLNIQKSLVHIDAVALNEEKINGVYEAIPEIATLVSHMDSLVRMAQVLPQLEAVFENLDAIFLIGSNVGHIVNVSKNMGTILEASEYVAELYTLIEEIKGIESNIASLEASTRTQAGIATTQAGIATTQAAEAKTQAGVSTTQAANAKGSATQAANSATTSEASAQKAISSESKSKVSETNAANSAASALASKNAATTAIQTVNTVRDEVVAVGTHVDAVQVVVDADKTTVAAYRTEVASNASKVAVDKTAVETAKTAAMNAATLAETRAQVATTKAAEAADSAKTAGELVTGVLQDAGSFESTGTLPRPPEIGGIKRSAMWKVTTAGTSGGIELAVGDSLVYTAGSASYYKIDNTESVTSVQNKRGAVTLNAADVGAAPTTHVHAVGDVVGLQGLLEGKAPVLHTHGIGDITGLNTALNGKLGINDNAVSATKLATTRTIALSGDATGSVNFDGTGNVTIPVVVTDNSHNHTVANVTGLQAAMDTKLDKAEAFEDVPFPDVWIPFSDNLRMLAGYGDDIKVGDYTVATQASFSRASTATYIDKSGVLRTAAVNEPRFEKEGLLIEGQSTNLITKSEGWVSSLFADGEWVHSAKDAEGFITVNVKTVATAPEGTHVNFSTATTGVHTFSLDVKKTPGLYVIIRFYGSAAGPSARTIALREASTSGYTAGVADMGAYWRVTMADDFNATGSKIARIYPAGDGGTPSGSMTYRRTQLEALPFASSYIPTNGAAATRAGDVCSIPSAGNYKAVYGVNAAEMTVSVNYDAVQAGVVRYICTAETTGGGVSLHSLVIRSEDLINASVLIGNSQLLCAANGLAVYAQIPSARKIRTALGETTFYGLTNAYIVRPNVDIGRRGVNDSGYLFGHIRNFRIWHTALTDAQIKGLK